VNNDLLFHINQATDKTIEVYKILSGEQLEKKQKRKQKKLKKK